MTRIVAIALLVVALAGCKRRRERLVWHDAPPAADASLDARVWPGTPAEDGWQLTPEQQARLDSLVEGTSPHVSCNELLRLMRRFAACKGVPPDMRSQMLQAVLSLSEMFEKSDGATDATCAEGITLWDRSVTSLGC